MKLRDAGMSELMADYVLYGVLHFYRSMDRYAAQQPNAQWQPHAVPDKANWPVGVLGLGAIGSYVASALQQAGLPVLGWSRTPKQISGVRCLHGEDGLNELLNQAQSVVTILPIQRLPSTFLTPSGWHNCRKVPASLTQAVVA